MKPTGRIKILAVTVIVALVVVAGSIAYLERGPSNGQPEEQIEVENVDLSYLSGHIGEFESKTIRVTGAVYPVSTSEFKFWLGGIEVRASVSETLPPENYGITLVGTVTEIGENSYAILLESWGAPVSDVSGSDIIGIPRYPGSVRIYYSEQVISNGTPEHRTDVVYLVSAAVEEVKNFYLTELPLTGTLYDNWEIFYHNTIIAAELTGLGRVYIRITPSENYLVYTQIDIRFFLAHELII